ncbi:MAG: outer membrane protein assembly factor BamD [Deltaproteobacteria bacterium]|nr:outer membrane protein assembly factor BamD [Deltaproteobacteria bacterium]
MKPSALTRLKASFLVFFLPLVLFTACSAKTVKPSVPSNAEDGYLHAVASYHNGLYEDAEAGFKRVMDDFPLDPYAVESQLMIADVYYFTERYEDAAAYYTTFQSFHPAHSMAPYALFQKGMSHFKDVLVVDRDQTSTKKALFAFEDLLMDYPASPYTEKAGELVTFLKRRLADRELYVGKFYFKAKNFKGALMRFGAILKDYPDVGVADEALYYIGESYVKLGEKDLARDAFKTLVSKFPGSPLTAYAKDRLRGG